MLDDVGQRLLDDAVEGGFDVGWKPLADPRLEVDAHAGLLGEGVAQPLERRREPEVVERLRPQLDSQAAHVVQRLDDLLAHSGQGLDALGVALSLLDRLQAEQHRGQLLPGLVMKLAGQPAPFELLRLDDATERVARHSRRQVDGDRGARSEDLREAKVVVAKRGSSPSLSWATMTPIGRAPTTSGT